ncbi:ferrous iron transport protein A [Psychroflexus gondwanensis]|jgi:ferrous iron transport protein A|uniref:Ferrous iron-binding transport protein FeoA n=1 Tax=Psychroflexus gondwanensis ACAM 44 TaxID=1189619 RepID=N1WUB4_9FLAO|nr:FeoA family protein [Psychroflexus gondwanensis]EMY80719.1 ferrous iron-binding transport protein FeoA [Psychroflexus gondwanensis ACAM 44]TXE19500.1 ferrous iron transport protein A [Psychroflexus gondwanensis]
MLTIASLKKGQKAIIGEMTSQDIPLKLLEMGCLPGNHVELIQIAPFKDPLYLNINDTFLSIRRETAKLIHIELIPDE